MTGIQLIAYSASVTLLVLSNYVDKGVYYRVLGKLVGYVLLICTVILLYQFGLVDSFSLSLGLSFTLISFLISVYTLFYREAHHYPKHLETLIDLFLVFIISAYIAPSFILMIVAWTSGEILGYVLIKLGEEHSSEGPLTSSRGFIFASTLTYEISVFTLITLSIIFTTAGIGLYELMKPFTQQLAVVAIPVIIIPLLVVGFITKTANIPLHFWLPSAHSSAPSPASATLSGLMVSLGYYGLYRVISVVDIDAYRAPISWFFVLVGFLSIMYGGFQALAQRDVKKLLAYMTIATNGFISVVFGLYVMRPLDITKWTLVIGMVMHAAYKATLFCESGLIEVVYGTRYVHGIRGFARIASLSTMGSILAILSLLGVPGTLGFIAKLLAVYNSILIVGTDSAMSVTSLLAFLAYIIISALAALKYARIYYDGASSRVKALVEKLDWGLQAPVLVLGLLNVLLCVLVVAFLTQEYGYILALITPLPIITMYLAHAQFRITSTR
ncbi:MAG: proton-conducting transporter membrane subunit [Desulfurococcaceae archaeon]